MVTDAIIAFFFNVVNMLLDLLPDVTLPEWATSSTGALATVLTYAGSMGAWFPTGLLGSVLLALSLTWLVGFLIKAVRIVLSLFTAGGGSAA